MIPRLRFLRPGLHRWVLVLRAGRRGGRRRGRFGRGAGRGPRRCWPWPATHHLCVLQLRRRRIVAVLHQDRNAAVGGIVRDCFSRAATGRRSRAPASPGRRARHPAAAAAARSWRGRPRAPSCCSRRRSSIARRRCGPRSAVGWAASSVPRPAAPAAPARWGSVSRCRFGKTCRSCPRSIRCAGPPV